MNFYIQFFSYIFGGNCRFYPSCSNYAKDAIANHNIVKAFALISIRLMKCHPFGSSGYDPVPLKVSRGCCHEPTKQ